MGSLPNTWSTGSNLIQNLYRQPMPIPGTNTQAIPVDWIESHSEPVPATHADTWYKYAGDTEWRTVSISGGINGSYDEESDYDVPTTQIPNIWNVVALEIGTDVTSIGDLAFIGCDRLTSLAIPNSVTYIGGGAFASCSSLTSVTIPSSVTSIYNEVFNGCSGLTSVTIPDSVTSIGHSAFLDCSGLTSMTIPNSVTSIEDDAFYGCNELTSVTIPDSVTNIGNNAFGECSGFTSVTITANGGNAANVKQMMIDAGVSEDITWNMPA